MDEYEFQEVYDSLAPASDRIYDALSVEEDDADDLAVCDSADTKDFLPLRPQPQLQLECRVCRCLFTSSRAARSHVELCAFYNPLFKVEEGATSPPSTPASKKRVCAPTNLEEPRSRKRRRVAEYSVERILDHSENSVLVRWNDGVFADSWEPVTNFFDLDENGEVTSVNEHLLDYQRERGVSLIAR